MKNKKFSFNVKDYLSFTIVAPGWSLTVYSLNKAMKYFDDLSVCGLYGNKFDGKRSLIAERNRV